MRLITTDNNTTKSYKTIANAMDAVIKMEKLIGEEFTVVMSICKDNRVSPVFLLKETQLSSCMMCLATNGFMTVRT